MPCMGHVPGVWGAACVAAAGADDHMVYAGRHVIHVRHVGGGRGPDDPGGLL
jgi:hypothetical protein